MLCFSPLAGPPHPSPLPPSFFITLLKLSARPASLFHVPICCWLWMLSRSLGDLGGSGARLISTFTPYSFLLPTLKFLSSLWLFGNFVPQQTYFLSPTPHELGFFHCWIGSYISSLTLNYFLILCPYQTRRSILCSCFVLKTNKNLIFKLLLIMCVWGGWGCEHMYTWTQVSMRPELLDPLEL